MAESSLYPTAIDSTNIYEVVARLSTTLTADITAATTTIPLASTTGFPTQGYIVIDNETIKYISVSVGSVDATGGRGHAGTAASHTNTTQVLVAVTAAVINKLRAGLIAVQTKVGIGTLMPNGDNLLLNPEFQVGETANLPLYWTLELTPTLALAADTLFPALGGNQITITGAGAAYEGIQIKGAVANWLKVKPSTAYTFSIDYKVTAGDALNLSIVSYNGATSGTSHLNSNVYTSTTAVRVSFTFTTDADATNLEIFLRAAADGDIVIVSHLKLEEGSITTPFEPVFSRARLKSKIIAATRDMAAASGDVSYTGLDFTPTSIMCIGTINGVAGYFTIGFADSAKTSGDIFPYDAGVTVGAGTTLVNMATSVTANQIAIVKTYDINVGFTLTWVKTGSPTGTLTLKFLCFR